MILSNRRKKTREILDYLYYLFNTPTSSLTEEEKEFLQEVENYESEKNLKFGVDRIYKHFNKNGRIDDLYQQHKLKNDLIVGGETC